LLRRSPLRQGRTASPFFLSKQLAFSSIRDVGCSRCRGDEGERAAADWSGLIAFDGRTVRATEQTRFYPTPLDVETGEELDQQAYDVEVACRGIYWNGSAPAQGPLGASVPSVTQSSL
jgi:hypothetical protein